MLQRKCYKFFVNSRFPARLFRLINIMMRNVIKINVWKDESSYFLVHIFLDVYEQKDVISKGASLRLGWV